MASISTDAKGNRRIQFIDRNKKRHAIYLGKTPMKTVQTVCLRIENLVTASAMNVEPDLATSQWTTQISDDLADKLAKVGLIEPRKKSGTPENQQLGVFLNAYIASRGDAKPDTKTVWGHCQRNLLDHFGQDRDIASITKPEAIAFKTFLVNEGLGGETIKKRIQVCRMFFRSATDQGLCPENPFKAVPTASGGVKRSRQVFVPRDTVSAVYPYCSDDLRLILILTRYGGLRCPTEVASLRWQDINWQEGRMTITSPKTEHHEDRESRVCPLFPEVRQELEKARDRTKGGSEYVLAALRKRWQTVRGWRACNIRTQMHRAIKKAGIKPWPKLFNSLRGSCETELAHTFPIQVVCSWLGNSPKLAMKHYLHVRPEDFERASGVSQNPAQKAEEACGKHSQPKEEIPMVGGDTASKAVKVRGLVNGQVVPDRTEPRLKSEANPGVQESSVSEYDAISEELHYLKSAWLLIPEPVRFRIVQMVEEGLKEANAL